MVSDEHLVRDTRRQRDQPGGDEDDQEEVIQGWRVLLQQRTWDPKHGTFLSHSAFWKHPHPLMRWAHPSLALTASQLSPGWAKLPFLQEGYSNNSDLIFLLKIIPVCSANKQGAALWEACSQAARIRLCRSQQRQPSDDLELLAADLACPWGRGGLPSSPHSGLSQAKGCCCHGPTPYPLVTSLPCDSLESGAICYNERVSGNNHFEQEEFNFSFSSFLSSHPPFLPSFLPSSLPYSISLPPSPSLPPPSFSLNYG